MNKNEIKAYLASASASGIRPGLERMRELCRRLGDPQEKIRVIHVAGTNGKGSTSAYLASILSRVCGKTGWYSSPAVFDDRETIQIVTPEEKYMLPETTYETVMSSVIETAQAMVEGGFEQPTVYELETAGAFLSFQEEKVDIAIVEVGMGGREDATNLILHPVLSVITPIGLDHMQYLGGSVYQIAGEKAGIIKDGSPVVSYQPGIRLDTGATNAAKRQERLRERILGRLEEEAKEKHTSIRYVEEKSLRIDRQELSGTAFTYRDEAYFTRMCGTFQPANAALAIETAEQLEELRQKGDFIPEMKPVSREVIREGIADAVWPARFDIVSEEPLTIFDGAHNTDGVAVLSETLKALLPGRRIYAVMGVFKDKAAEEMVRQILPYLTEVMTVQAPGPRGLEAEALTDVIRRVNPWTTVYEGDQDIASAVRRMQEKAEKDGAVVLVFGSLSLARAVYQDKPAMSIGDVFRKYERTSDGSEEDTDTIRLPGDAGKSLLTQLQEKGVSVPAVCGGNGQCGKCKVRVVSGTVPITEDDRKVFSHKELSDGWRLACLAKSEKDVVVERPAAYEELQAVADTVIQQPSNDEENTVKDTGRKYGIAIDIGTTTLAVSLVRRSDATRIDTRTRENPQVSFGADVISRIKAAEEGRAEAMRVSICEALLEEIETSLVRNGLGYAEVETVVIAGNTTMLHLLQGYDVSGLGKHPFTPVTVACEAKKMGDIFDVVPDWELEEITKAVPVILMPGVSAFVGADIVSGLLALDFDKNDKICALIDLGTNGEIVIGDSNRRLVTSTAAGPALEGGNIRCGTASVKGAVSGVRLEKDENGDLQANVERIGDYAAFRSNRPNGPGETAGQSELKEASGICGTGVIDMVAELKRVGLVDETGLMAEPYFEDGFPFAVHADGTILTFKQEDVREVQLAKAAIRAGFETLCERYGIVPDEIGKVYIAGGFGTFLHIDQAVAIGLLPEEIADRAEAVGNTSLAGAIRLLVEPDEVKRLREIADGCETVSLAEDEAFQKRYIESMSL